MNDLDNVPFIEVPNKVNVHTNTIIMERTEGVKYVYRKRNRKRHNNKLKPSQATAVKRKMHQHVSSKDMTSMEVWGAVKLPFFVVGKCLNTLETAIS